MREEGKYNTQLPIRNRQQVQTATKTRPGSGPCKSVFSVVRSAGKSQGHITVIQPFRNAG